MSRTISVNVLFFARCILAYLVKLANKVALYSKGSRFLFCRLLELLQFLSCCLSVATIIAISGGLRYHVDIKRLFNTHERPFDPRIIALVGHDGNLEF